MFVVETKQEFETFRETFKKLGGTVIPIFVDNKAHPAINKLCVLFVFCFDSKTWSWIKYALTFDHNDGDKLDVCNLDKLWTTEPVFTPSVKALLHHWHLPLALKDLNTVQFNFNGQLPDPQTFYTPLMRKMYAKFHNVPTINRAIPVYDLFKFAEAYMDSFHEARKASAWLLSNNFNHNVIIPTCHFMEASGIYVDEKVFVAKFGERGREQIHNGLVYTEFNPYTVAGRVTSRFGGINYAALDKSDVTRDAFISRFGDRGRMVLIDFESFHLRLIANLIGFELPNEPVHEWLGKQYFNTDTLTKEQYEEGKQFTFQNIYGGGKGVNIPFFQEISNYIDKVWDLIQTQKYLITPMGRCIQLDRIEDANPAKVFNYLLQAVETEVAMNGISGLMTAYNGKKSKVVLYTYDSILIDFSIEDGKGLLLDTIRILEQNRKYPVRIYSGTTYKNVQPGTLNHQLTTV
jgi:hypothetical protein